MTFSEKNWSLSLRALMVACVLAVIASLVIGLPLARSAIEHLEQQQSQLRQTLTKQISVQAAESIFSQDLLSLNVILSSAVEDNGVLYAAVYDLNNTLMAEQGRANESISQPISIQYQNEVIGLLEVMLNSQPLTKLTVQLYSLWFVLSLIFIIISALAGWFVGRMLGRKLETSQYELENLGTIKQVTPLHTGEFKDFSDALAKLHDSTTGQRLMHQALSQFMQPQITPSWQNRQLGTESDYTQGAVLLIKIANLDHAQQNMDKSELAQLLDQHFNLIQQAAKLYNGCVANYEHDGVLVLFSQEQNDEKHNFHGICTGLLVLGLVKQVNAERKKHNLQSVEFQLALHSGDILQRRFPSLNQVETQPWLAMNNDREASHGAALLCAQSEANGLLVSKPAIEQGQLASQLILSKHHNLTQLNTGDPVVSYWVEGFIPNYQALIDRQVEHLGAQLLQSE